jgi:hypothetical protein
MLTNLLVLTILVTNLATSHAAVPTWYPGDIFLWGVLDSTITETYAIDDDVGQIIDITTTSEIIYNITAIDTVQKEYDAYQTTAGGTTFLNDRDYDALEFVDDYVDNLGNFIAVNYIWDFENNVSVCNSFGTSLGFYYLIEPDWLVINDAFKDMLNGSVIIDTLNDPYSSTIFNYTLADVMNDIKIRIMGKGSFDSAVNQFLSTKNKWTFSFDLSNYLMDGYWNGSMTLYRPYTTYIESWELEFDNGGVLKNFQYILEYELSTDTTRQYVRIESRRALGGMKAATSNFATFAAIGGLIATSTIILIIKRKKK